MATCREYDGCFSLSSGFRAYRNWASTPKIPSSSPVTATSVWLGGRLWSCGGKGRLILLKMWIRKPNQHSFFCSFLHLRKCTTPSHHYCYAIFPFWPLTRRSESGTNSTAEAETREYVSVRMCWRQKTQINCQILVRNKEGACHRAGLNAEAAAKKQREHSN